MFDRLSKLHRLFSTHPMSRDAPARAWFRFVNWQLQSRMRDELIVPWIGGQRLAVKNGLKGATGNIYVGLHEFADMCFLLHFLRDGDLFLDVGANVGSFTILASGVCRATTWAFEPDPDTAARLERNIRLNALEGRARVFECAVGDIREKVKFTVGLDTVNKISGSDEDNSRIVQQERLDDIIGNSAPVMMKIDVEGYEENVIVGAGNLLQKPALEAIEIETVNDNIIDVLTSHGFTRAYYDPFERRLSPQANGFEHNNFLYIRDWAFVESRVAAAPKREVLGRLI